MLLTCFLFCLDVLTFSLFSLAMAEMTALVVAIYRGYSTSISPGFEDKSPAITSRFELFYDETMAEFEVRDNHR